MHIFYLLGTAEPPTDKPEPPKPTTPKPKPTTTKPKPKPGNHVVMLFPLIVLKYFIVRLYIH